MLPGTGGARACMGRGSGKCYHRAAASGSAQASLPVGRRRSPRVRFVHFGTSTLSFPPERRIDGLMLVMVCLILGACAGLSSRSERLNLPQIGPFSASRPGEPLPAGWKPWGLTRFKRATEYRLVDEQGRTVVAARAEGSASGLVYPVDADPGEFPILRWRWMVPALIPDADNTQGPTEDSPARVVVAFAGDRKKLPLADRLFFTQFKLFTKSELPYATLMYIWENRVPEGTMLANPHTSRIRMVVAESGEARLGQWVEEEHNVAEDYRRAFGADPGHITAIAILTDADNTGEAATAYYGDISLGPENH